MIQQNFERELSEDDSMKLLEMLEKGGIGKNRAATINEYLSALENKTSWNIFHALTRFSTMEKNINVKKLVENIAESVLVVPVQMIEAVETFNANLAQAA